jgi:hypothetical protein
MRKQTFRILTLISTGICGLAIADSSAPATLSTASTPAVAWSSGVLRINGADHSGSGNVLPGQRLETLRSTGQLYLADGSRLRLGAATQVSVDQQALKLEGGAARIESVPAGTEAIRISAGLLQIQASSGTIERPRPNQVIVTAAKAPTVVRHSNGMLVARVLPGQTLAFSMPASNSSSTSAQFIGCVYLKNGNYYITDETTHVTTQLDYAQASKYNGQRVQVHGELVPNPTPDKTRLKVAEISAVQAGATPAGQTANKAPACSANPAAIATGAAGAGAGAAAAGTGTAAAGAAGTAAATAAGLSTTAMVGIGIGAAAAVGTTLGVVAAQEDATISRP